MSTINPRGRRVGELQARADCCLGKEERTGWGRLIDFGLSSGLTEMMKLLAHGQLPGQPDHSKPFNQPNLVCQGNH